MSSTRLFAPKEIAMPPIPAVVMIAEVLTPNILSADKNHVNMMMIESRPIPGRNWEYRFFVDIEGNLQDAGVKNALRGIGAEAQNFKILGNY